MWQIVFADVPVKGWIIHPYVNYFFNCSNEVPVLPAHCAEVVNSCGMTCDVIMVINGEEAIEMFLEPLSENSCIFINVFFITLHLGTLVSVDHPIHLHDGISIFGVKLHHNKRLHQQEKLTYNQFNLEIQPFYFRK